MFIHCLHQKRTWFTMLFHGLPRYFMIQPKLTSNEFSEIDC